VEVSTRGQIDDAANDVEVPGVPEIDAMTLDRSDTDTAYARALANYRRTGKAPNLFLLLSEGQRKACPPFHDADHVVVEGVCPLCGCEPFKVVGTGMRPSDDDRAWESDAVALCCNAPVGTLRLASSMLFGIREGRAVLSRYCCIY
jgi:hypothetical protein